jgi:hypothetical protein
MNSIRDILFSLLVRFDDEAFAALASRGLLRRAQKDLEKIPATIVEESEKDLVIGIADYRIRFDERGPAHAVCSCKSAGVCQHILAAALSLQKYGGRKSPDGTKAGGDAAAAPSAKTPSAESPAGGSDGKGSLEDLHSALLDFTAAALSSYGGKPGYRWAWQYVQDLDCDRDISVEANTYIIIGLTHPRIVFRYMGGGLDNLICDVQTSKLKKLRIAAVLAYQKVNGKPISAPAASTQSGITAMNLGKDFAFLASQESADEESRSRLRARALQIFSESIRLGLSHLTPGFYERFSALAVWAQGAKYYRLALVFRRLADHVELLLDRSANADEQKLFDELTIAFAMVSALEEAGKSRVEPQHLIGVARNSYELSGTLEVFGLGAHAWRSSSGYVGLTVLFWSPGDDSFFSFSDARPEIVLRGFNPIARYTAPGPWTGLTSPSSATGRRLILADAAISQIGRISGSDGITANVGSFFSRSEVASRSHIIQSWSDLFKRRKEARWSLLSEPDSMKDWVLVLPMRFGKPYFDAIRQTLVWPLFDAADQCINAELPYSDFSSHAISRIENIDPHEMKEGTLLVARIRPGSSGRVIEPLSVIKATASELENSIDCLHFDKGAASFGSKWLAKIKNLGSNTPRNQSEMDALVRIPAQLEELGQWLKNKAERGSSTGTEDEFAREFQTQCRKVVSAGFSAFGCSHDGNVQAAIHLLRAHYIQLQYERLFDESQESII